MVRLVMSDRWAWLRIIATRTRCWIDSGDARRIDWANEEDLYNIDWSIYREFLGVRHLAPNAREGERTGRACPA